jgi:hypothetical protein
MNIPTPNVSINMVRRWDIRLPQVYRYLNKIFVDEFFESGKLRLSSFHHFSTHKDEARFDGEEGKGMVIHNNLEANKSVSGYVIYGQSSYVLCGSTIYSKTIEKQFGTNSGFRINDPLAFVDVVGHHLPGFTGGFQGHCIYSPQRLVMRDLGPEAHKTLMDKSGNIKIEDLSRFVDGISGNDMMFLKHADYSPQSEYRFIWNINQNNVRGTKDIYISEAIQFCTRFENLNLSCIE